MKKINLLILLLLLNLLMSCQDFEQSSIKSYSSVAFDFELEKPFVFRNEKKLYYSQGKSKDIEKNEIYQLSDKPDYHERNIFISPDSKWIVIRDDGELILLDNSGKTKTVLGKTKNELSFEFEKNRFRWENIQFSKDSKYILLIKDKEQKNGRTKSNEIFLFELASKKLESIHLAPYIIESHFSLSNKSLFYAYFDTPNTMEIVEVDFTNNNNLKIHKNFNDSLLFINFDARDLHNHTSDMTSQITDMWKLKSFDDISRKEGIYLRKNDSTILLMESTLANPNFKGFRVSNHHSNKSYFLPGDRYYAFENNSQEYRGFLIYDTEKLIYQEFGKNIDFYFSLTTNDVHESVNKNLDYK